MIKVKLNDVSPFLRGNGCKEVLVDEAKLDFINGLAYADGKMIVQDETEELEYACSGIINENFEEVFSKQDDLASRSLMFRPINKKVLRCGADNFIVRVDNGFSYGKFQIKYIHIRLVEESPKIINRNLGPILKTNLENIVIANYQFYDVATGEYVTPKFERVSTISEDNEIYFVTDKLKTEEIGDEYIERKYEDLWNFQMNAQLEILSPILSKMDCGIIEETCQNMSEYENLRKLRLELLLKKEKQFDNYVRSLTKNKN